MSQHQPITGPEFIVPSLDWSKKLKAAGYPQGGDAWNKGPGWPQWVWFDGYGKPGDPPFLALNQGEDHDFHQFYWAAEEATVSAVPDVMYAAPTAEEVLRNLPIRVIMDVDGRERTVLTGLGRGLAYLYYDDYDSVDGVCQEGEIEGAYFSEDSLAAALAACYCYLAEHGLLPR